MLGWLFANRSDSNLFDSRRRGGETTGQFNLAFSEVGVLRKRRDIGIYTQRFGFCDLSGFCSLGTFVPVGDSSDYRFALAARHPACLRQKPTLGIGLQPGGKRRSRGP